MAAAGLNDKDGYVIGEARNRMVVMWNMWLRGKDRTNSNVYIQGIPGTGKSTLIKFFQLLEYAINDTTQIVWDAEREFIETPSMQNTNIANLCAEMFGIFCKFIDSSGCCSPPARFINCINIYQPNGEQERVIYMKKMFILVMAVMLCFTLTACNEEENIDFPFELSSIENVEMFRFINPADAEKKVITKSEDIEEIYQTFESVSLKDKTTEPTAGGSVTSFRFNLSDGTSYEVIYSEVAVKAGRVITTGMEQDFFTSADIGAFWGSYDYEVTTASEDELPALYE